MAEATRISLSKHCEQRWACVELDGQKATDASRDWTGQSICFEVNGQLPIIDNVKHIQGTALLRGAVETVHTVDFVLDVCD
jgi:hypothetical protein